jgi:hypothetical protein
MRCVALAHLAASGSIDRIPVKIVEIIRKAAARETQSTMRARVEGRELSLVATRLGIPIAAKGCSNEELAVANFN